MEQKKCNRCGGVADLSHQCYAWGGVDHTHDPLVYFENRYDGTRPKIDKRGTDPKVNLKNIKIRGLRKI